MPDSSSLPGDLPIVPDHAWARWEGPDGFELSLALGAYEFPEVSDSQNPDSQWLQVHLRFRGPGIDQSFSDPCLTLTDAASLAIWWETLAVTAPGALPEPAITFLDFAEPQLAFGLRSSEAEGIRLAIVSPQPDDDTRIPEAWPDPLEVLVPREVLAANAAAWVRSINALAPRA